MDNHKQIPTWIMIKVVNFSTFIDIIRYSKIEVSHSLCSLYGLEDENGRANVKLLIGSLHWMRKIRNSCAHNERFIAFLAKKIHVANLVGFLKNICVLLVLVIRGIWIRKYLTWLYISSYYLPKIEYKQFISEFKNTLTDLQTKIHPHAFEYVRGQIGIRNISDLDLLIALPKDEIEYNKFDKQDLF